MSDRFTAEKLAWLEQIATSPDLSPLAKVVAFIIGTKYLNRETGDAWPAIETLAADAGKGKTQVQEAAKTLQASGHITITVTPGGRGKTNRYRPVLKPSDFPEGNNAKPSGGPEGKPSKPSGNPDPSESETLRISGLNPPEIRAKPPGIPEGNPYEEPYEEPIEVESISTASKASKGKIEDAEFDRFWRVYPRREAKGAARRAYEKARKTAAVETIIEGATRYAKERAFEDPKYTKHPATWLNGLCWEDEPAQPHIIPPGASGGGVHDRGQKTYLQQFLEWQGTKQ